MIVGALGCIGVLLDYLHYNCAVNAASRAIENKQEGHEHQYGKTWSSLKWRDRFYKGRTWLSIIGTVVLIIVIVASWFDFRAANATSGELGPTIVGECQPGWMVFEDRKSHLRCAPIRIPQVAKSNPDPHDKGKPGWTGAPTARTETGMAVNGTPRR